MKRLFWLFGLLVLWVPLQAAVRSVNVYVWGAEIPRSVVQSFEESSGIQVHFSTYDSNETLYAKLKASGSGIYDVILPSSYFVERMHRQGMLTKLDFTQLSHLANLDKRFKNNPYDPYNQYSIPLIWGATGIVVNQLQHQTPPTHWSQLWEKAYQGQLLLLDDMREIFSVALMHLGYSPNDTDPKHLKAAYEVLLSLIPNIKLFASEGVQAILIDGDASTGVVWNGDAYKAHAENASIAFHYPKEGFIIWVDCLAIPANAPHPAEAYAFINYLLQADVAAKIGSAQGHAIANAAGKRLLPVELQENPMVYPSEKTLSRGVFQRDPGDKTMALISEYWQALKLAF